MEQITTTMTSIKTVDGDLTFANRMDHFLARWAWKRNDHRLDPGLYAIGRPDRGSPVFVTANYTLSFDALRTALKGIDGYILVLETYGINVWCAAGKGTFGTDELVERIEATGLEDAVTHRKIILPQLGAPGVDAFEVTKRTGFKVEYGPVKADDLREYLKTNKATPEMRRVKFPLIDRIVLIPVEFVASILPMVVMAIAGFLAGGLPMALAAIITFLTGTILFPVLMPFIPTKDYSTKGLLLGLIVALPFAGYTILSGPANSWVTYVSAVPFLLIMPPIVAYLSLNFTGATPYPSRTGVRKEIYTYIPVIAGMSLIGLVMLVAIVALKFFKVI